MSSPNTSMSPREKRAARTRALTLSALFAALAIVLAYVDAAIPYSVGAPGIKLGLANIVVLMALYEMDLRSAAAINIVRILVVGFTFSGVMAMAYSFAGGCLSLLVMYLLKKTGKFSMIGVSMAGGFAHNLGQLLVAAFIVENLKLFIYFPILIYTGIGAGIGMGIIAWYLDEKIPKQIFSAK